LSGSLPRDGRAASRDRAAHDDLVPARISGAVDLTRGQRQRSARTSEVASGLVPALHPPVTPAADPPAPAPRFRGLTLLRRADARGPSGALRVRAGRLRSAAGAGSRRDRAGGCELRGVPARAPAVHDLHARAAGSLLPIVRAASARRDDAAWRPGGVAVFAHWRASLRPERDQLPARSGVRSCAAAARASADERLPRWAGDAGPAARARVL